MSQPITKEDPENKADNKTIKTIKTIKTRKPKKKSTYTRDKLTTENIDLVKKQIEENKPLSCISRETGISAYYIKKIKEGTLEINK
jgi:hypothetical protein